MRRSGRVPALMQNFKGKKDCEKQPFMGGFRAVGVAMRR